MSMIPPVLGLPEGARLCVPPHHRDSGLLGGIIFVVAVVYQSSKWFDTPCMQSGQQVRLESRGWSYLCVLVSHHSADHSSHETRGLQNRRE